ncbi:Vacuolar ATP synthase subunit S1, partial [Harpegnathos saltator]
IEEIGRLTLEFFFSVKSMGYYMLKKVHYETSSTSDFLETKLDIYFPYNFSYHCSQNVVFINDMVYLNITNIQVQIDSKDATFNDAYDCVGFTSIPIWTGIFVTAILASIMTWALIMIMDIRTMDRFDDPKGKTITISAAE